MIANIINFFQKLYQENPSVAAILGVSSAGLVTSIVYVFRSNIIALFYWLKKQFTTSFYLTDENGSVEVFNLVLQWLKQYNKLYTRSLKSPQHFNIDDLQRDKISDVLQYGLGKNLIWYHRRPVWLYITEEKIENSRERKMSLSLSILGRSHNLIYDLLDEVYKWYAKKVKEEWKNKTKVNVYGYGGIDATTIIHKRGFDTVYLPSKIENEIKHNIHKFFDNKDLYTKHGIPYHYGMILYGPPGTGKTSIVKAIASEFDLDIFLIDPLKTDITKIKKGAKTKLLVIEDIDLLIGAKREAVEEIELEEDEDNILGNIIKVDRALYEEYEMKKTMTCFDSGDYTLLFTYSIDGEKELFLLHDGYYLLEITNVTDTEITLLVKEQVPPDIEHMCKYFSHLNSDNQKLGIIEDKDKYINSNEYIFKFNKEELFVHCKKHDVLFTNELDNKEYQFIFNIAFTPISFEQMENAFNDGVLELVYDERNDGNIYLHLLTYESFDEEYMYFKLCQDNIEIKTESKENNYDIKLSTDEINIILAGKHKIYALIQNAQLMASCNPAKEDYTINNIRAGSFYLVDNEKAYEYMDEDNDYIYFAHSLKGTQLYHDFYEYESALESELFGEEQEKINYDVKIKINILEQMFDKQHKEYALFGLTIISNLEKVKHNLLNDIRKHTLFLEKRKENKTYTYINEDEEYFYFIYSPIPDSQPRYSIVIDPNNGYLNDEENYDYSIPLNILHGNSWEKPFPTNEGINLYIWMTGQNNPTTDLPKSDYNFLNHIIVGNLYFFDTPKRHNFSKAYKYHSHDDDNLYIVETNYESPVITVAQTRTVSSDNTIKTTNKVKSVDANKNSGGKKVLRDLMNAIDGLITQENFIIIATTNSIESLDPALIRPGRFDTAIKIDYIDIEVFNKVMMRYFGKTVNGKLRKKNLTISRLQVEFLMGKTFADFCKKYISEE